MISLIYAIDKNNLIGKENDLPWHYSSDLKYFKEKTSGKTVVMGKNTFESIVNRLNKPLPNRNNIVVTSNPFFNYPAVTVINNFENYLESIKDNSDDIFIIGGKQIYKRAFEYAKYLYITYIDREHQGDIYLDLDLSLFELVSEAKEDFLYFRIYKRKI